MARNGVEVDNAIASVEFGLNKSWQLNLDEAVKTNKWEAVITFNASPGLPAASTITALHPVARRRTTAVMETQSGIRDAVGNPLARRGFTPGRTRYVALLHYRYVRR